MIVAIREVPVEQRGHAGGEKDGMIAAPFVRVRLHHPARVARTPQAHGQMHVVQQVALQRVGGHVSRSPFRVRIRWTHPHGGRIGLLLDEKGATGLRHVLAGHVEREGVADAARPRGVGTQPLPARRDFVTPQKRQRACRTRDCAARNPGRERTGHLEQGGAPARVIVCAGFLDVGDQHDPFVRMGATGDLGNERAIGPRTKLRRDGDLQGHLARRPAFLEANREARRDLETKRVQRLVVGNAAPLNDVGSLVRLRIWGGGGGQNAGRSALSNRHVEQPPRVCLAEHDLAAHVHLRVVGRTHAAPDDHQPGAHAAGRRRKRVDAERHAVERARHVQNDGARPVSGRAGRDIRHRDGRGDGLPGRRAIRKLLVPLHLSRLRGRGCLGRRPHHPESGFRKVVADPIL